MTRHTLGPRFAGFAAALAVVFVATACSGGTPPGSGGRSGGGDPIKFGLLTPLSGPQPDRGKILQVAAELAVKDINDAGGINGRQVELVVADDANDTNQGVTAAQRLIEQDKVVALTGILSSTRQEAIQPIAERAEVVVMGVIATSTGLTDGFRFAFRATGSNDTIGPQIAKLATDNGATKVAILNDNTTYAQSLAKETLAGFKATSAQIVAQEQYQTGAADVTPQILKVQSSNADAVVPFPITGADIALIVKTMVANGVLKPIFSHNGVFTTEAIKLATADYAKLPGVWGMGTIDTSRQQAVDFYDRMDKAAGFDVPQNEDAGQTYDAVRLLGEGLKKSNGQSGMALVQALESIDNYVGIAGAEGSYYSFSKDKHTGLTGDYLAVYKFVDGKFEIQK